MSTHWPLTSSCNGKEIRSTHNIGAQKAMGAKNISISEEAYARLATLKGPRESFTDVINRLTGRRSILEMAGVLTPSEGRELRVNVRDLLLASQRRVDSTARRTRV